MDDKELKILSTQLRKLADRLDGLASGRIESSETELNKIRLLVSLVVRELMEVWL